MKQILQSLRTGKTEVADVPPPIVRRGHLLMCSARSLVSSGTERMLVEFGKGNFIEKARQQPDKVRMVIDKMRTDGVKPTIDAVFNKLDEPLALGYCNVGTVIAIGPGVSGFAIGDRVASNGKHAEFTAVARNLCAKIPDSVSDDAAAFTVLGAIALQGIRLVKPSLGEAVVVTGLGLIGLLTVQLLRAHGCRVLGIDPDRSKAELARQFGAEIVDLAGGQDVLKAAQAFSRDRGVDAVIITASTASSEPVRLAANMCRKRGRIILVGVTGLELSRADFFEKELSFQVSCSYGPGRYDPDYEEKGQDYPVGFVRWTEQRNFEAVLDMLAEGRLNVEPMISHRFGIEQAAEAYELICGDQPSLGVLLQYSARAEGAQKRTIVMPSVAANRIAVAHDNSLPSLSFIGAGNYAKGVLLPAFKATGAKFHSIASATGATGALAARKFGFAEATSDVPHLIGDDTSDAVVITTPHSSHAAMVIDALNAGKHVFVEKPMCLTLDELSAIEQAYQRADDLVVMVGFNRRFAPHVGRMKELLHNSSGPLAMVMTVNAGHIDGDHWTQDLDVGGGRIVGEACHFVDLLRFLAGSPISASQRSTMAGGAHDTVSISLTFENGSIGTIHYLANGAKAFPKERLEIFDSGRILQLDNFRTLRGFGWSGFSKMKLWQQDKGQRACAKAFVKAISDGTSSPIPWNELLEVSRVSIELAAH